MSDFTQNQEIWQWLDAHWEEFADYWQSKMKDVSSVELINYDQDKVKGVLASFRWQGVNKVVTVTPQSLLQGLAQLNEELRERCEEAAEAAENAATYANQKGDYALSEGQRVDALITEITTLKAQVKQQGDTAQAQGAAADSLRQQIESWYSPFKAAAETWFTNAQQSWSTWFEGVKSEWSSWFNARKQEWNTWYNDTTTTWSAWYNGWVTRMQTFFNDVSDNWDDMTFMFSDTVWNSQTVYLRNKAVADSQGNWWVSLKSTSDNPNVNHPLPGFDSQGNPNPSEWWRLWIDWQHPLARVLAAALNADQSAQNADEKAQMALEAAEEARQVDVVDHEERIALLESTVRGLSEEDIVEINNAISALQALIGADVDGNINKFNEIINFLSGISEGSELQQMFADIAAQIATKQPAGDYATNSRVNTIEAKVDRLASPRFEGKALVFPAESTAYFDNKALVLTQ